MRILIVTPLYPPDIAGSAPYVKELASRLVKEHTVSVLAYNHIPESVEGVRIITVEKSDALFARLTNFLRTLYREMQDVDIVFAENGPSVELPIVLVHLFRRRKIIFHLGDATSLDHARKSFWYRIPLSLARASATQVLEQTNSSRPALRPEILPFKDFPHVEMRAYELSWSKHVSLLNKIFQSL